MSKINKLIDRMITIPNDFREADLDKVMSYFQYVKTMANGSGIKYYCAETNSLINFHHPHSGKSGIIKPCTIKDVVLELKTNGKILCG